ncbi:MAG: substrate-binding domain-containing protein [Hyphomicrobiales bacterium]|nr:substrate-binding domain-containing protein [Hyphomicrobiales bacterium]
MTSKVLTVLAALVIGTALYAAAVRDRISIVGSSTVFPFTQAVAEKFANKTGEAAPVVESTGTAVGMKLFCGGIGPDHPDLTGASRPMKESEYRACVANGIDSITEVQIGFDGIAFAHARSGVEMVLAKKQLFQALAAEVEVDGKIVANPYRKWSDIDASLPDAPITVFGPPPTSGTRDAWVELVMEQGCEEFAAIKKLDKNRIWKAACARMRQDGHFIEAGENDNLIVQWLDADHNAFGIFGFSFLHENEDKLKGVAIGGIVPSIDTIADGSYPVSRPLFFYIKNAHRGVIPGLEEFVTEYVSEQSMGDDGYLSEGGLIPLSAEKREEVRAAVKRGENVSRFGS